MYVPAHFAMSPSEVTELLSAITTVDLISTTPDGLVATFLPMIYDGQAGALLGHLARNNPHWRDAGGQSLIIARGPDAYVSPSWYATKAEHGRVVPTWNYVTAHVYGQLVVHEDVEWLRTLVTRLTERHEAGIEFPWSVSDAPPEYIDGQLRAIVGVELVIERIEAKSKLSQNRSVADRDGVRAALAAGTASERAVADRMATVPLDSGELQPGPGNVLGVERVQAPQDSLGTDQLLAELREDR
jgi:transcriptional regulator